MSNKKVNRKFCNYQISTLNCRTLKCEVKLQNTILEAKKLNIDLLLVQEHHIRGQDELGNFPGEISNFKFIYSGFSNKSYGGVGIICNSKVVTVQEIFTPIPGRLQLYRLTLGRTKILLASVYSPTDAQAESTKTTFYRSMCKEITNLRKKYPGYKFLAGGDFNATIGRESERLGLKCLGNNNDPLPTNNNGQNLIDLATKQKLTIVNSTFQTKNIHRITLVSARYKKRVDYFCADKYLFKYSENCRVYRGLNNDCSEFDTDHRLLTLKLKIPTKRHEKLLKLKANSTSAKNPSKSSKADIRLLQTNSDIREKYSKNLDNEISKFLQAENLNIHELSDKLLLAIKTATEETIPTKTSKISKNPWEDEFYQNLLERRRKTRGPDRKKIDKLVKKRAKILKSHFFRRKPLKLTTSMKLVRWRKFLLKQKNLTQV